MSLHAMLRVAELSGCGPEMTEGDVDLSLVEQGLVANCGTKLSVSAISATIEQKGNLAPGAVELGAFLAQQVSR